MSLVTCSCLSYNGGYKGHLVWCSFKYVKYFDFHLEDRGFIYINAMEVLNLIRPFCIIRWKHL